MREVRTCDFCGADGRGVYEVLPPEIDGGRRMILCPPCKDRLEGIVAPLLDRLDADGGVTHPRAERVRGGEGAQSNERHRERAASADPTPEGEPDAVADTDTNATAVADSGVAETVDEADTGGTEVEEAVDAVTDDAPEQTAASETIAREAAIPPAYRKVVRFLRNREFPMDRGEAEALAAGAYGLDDEVVHRIVEHAIAEGRFSSDGETLTRA